MLMLGCNYTGHSSQKWKMAKYVREGDYGKIFHVSLRVKGQVGSDADSDKNLLALNGYVHTFRAHR